ncbi:MAG: class I SAM-dependent methyltransferase, partial [Elusimicrobia bacterium]|nr:class I SAM-dependent methyltransferase [Elusimicrobiota bacterium]
FGAERFRLVTCFQTLEHLHDPLRFCADALSLLKPGGAFLAVCHDRLALSARLLGRRSPIYDVEHLQLFSPAALVRLLEKAGFSGVRVRPIFNRYPLHYWLKLSPLPAPLKAAFSGRFKRSALGRLPVSVPAGNMAVSGCKP